MKTTRWETPVSDCRWLDKVSVLDASKLHVTLEGELESGVVVVEIVSTRSMDTA